MLFTQCLGLPQNRGVAVVRTAVVAAVGRPVVVAYNPAGKSARPEGNDSSCLSMKRACGWCPKDPDEPYETSHGICDECLRKYFPEQAELILGQEEHYDYPTP